LNATNDPNAIDDLNDRNAPVDLLARKYAEDFSVPYELALIIAQRFPEYQKAKQFVFPDLAQLHDPATIPDIDPACAVIMEAVQRREMILIYCHDDADGYTAAALLYKTLGDLYRGSFQDRVYIYPLNREKDGYIINPDVLRTYRDQGVGLVITADFGISTSDNIRNTLALGMKLVICDHHETGAADFPVPVVDPKRPDSKYPFRELAGAGVSFKLCQYLYDKMLGLTAPEFYASKPEYLAIAMIGTIADRVNMTGENRVLCHAGLNAVNRINASWAECLRGDRFDFPAICTVILPMLASAATGDPITGITLFTNQTAAETGTIATKLRAGEDARHATIDRIFDDALAAAKFYPGIVISVLPATGVHYLGAVSARLRDHSRRVSCVISLRDNKGFGELRTTGLNLYQMLHELRSCFIDFGGHARAAGFSMHADMLDAFIEKSDRYTNAHSGEPVIPKLPVLTIDKPQVGLLMPLLPFGEDNPAPLLTDGIDMYTIDNRLKIIYQGPCQT